MKRAEELKQEQEAREKEARERAEKEAREKEAREREGAGRGADTTVTVGKGDDTPAKDSVKSKDGKFTATAREGGGMEVNFGAKETDPVKAMTTMLEDMGMKNGKDFTISKNEKTGKTEFKLTTESFEKFVNEKTPELKDALQEKSAHRETTQEKSAHRETTKNTSAGTSLEDKTLSKRKEAATKQMNKAEAKEKEHADGKGGVGTKTIGAIGALVGATVGTVGGALKGGFEGLRDGDGPIEKVGGAVIGTVKGAFKGCIEGAKSGYETGERAGNAGGQSYESSKRKGAENDLKNAAKFEQKINDRGLSGKFDAADKTRVEAWDRKKDAEGVASFTQKYEQELKGIAGKQETALSAQEKADKAASKVNDLEGKDKEKAQKDADKLQKAADKAHEAAGMGQEKDGKQKHVTQGDLDKTKEAIGIAGQQEKGAQEAAYKAHNTGREASHVHRSFHAGMQMGGTRGFESALKGLDQATKAEDVKEGGVKKGATAMSASAIQEKHDASKGK